MAQAPAYTETSRPPDMVLLVPQTSWDKDMLWVGEDPANQQQSWEHKAGLQLSREILCEL